MMRSAMMIAIGLFCLACASSTPGNGTDAGPARVGSDAGPPGASFFDAGPPGSSSFDAGPPGSSSCTPDIIPAPTTAVCAASTLTCLEGCTDDATCEACITADPMGDACGQCLEDSFLSCVNAAGCQTQWDAMLCCYDSCADPESAECDTTCASSSMAFDTCAEASSASCDDSICFAM
ncbi:MAG: hypothetical protein AB7S26_34725 [Sandaracinaceae bacterium]